MKTRILAMAFMLWHQASIAQNITTSNGTTSSGASSFVCVAGSFANKQNLNTASFTDYTHFDLLAGVGCSYWLHSTMNGLSEAGSYAGFHICTLTLASLLSGIRIETYLNGTKQEAVPGTDLVNILALGEGDIYFKSTKDFNEIRIVFGGLVSVAYSMDVFYGYGLASAPTGNILPLRLLRFEAQGLPDAIRFNWTIDTDEALEDMIVEASQDGLHFNGIAHLKPGTKEQEYSYTDKARSGIYYRLQLITDKQRYFSKIIKPRNAASTMNLFCNSPVIGSIQLKLSGAEGWYTLLLNNQNG